MARDDTYVFVDGGHLRADHASVVERWFGSVPDLDLGAIRASLEAHKVFYYDCTPEQKGDQEDKAAFDARRSEQVARLNKFRRAANCQVREGVLVGRKGKRPAQQKQVDILLAVDALSHAARGNMRTAVLVTGDQDFLPLVDSLVNLGLFVHVLSSAKSMSQDLADAADVFRPLRFTDYFGWTEKAASDKQPLPWRKETYEIPAGNSTTKGNVGGMPAVFHVRPDGRFSAYVGAPGPRKSDTWTHIRDRDRDRLELFCELEYGKVVGMP